MLFGYLFEARVLRMVDCTTIVEYEVKVDVSGVVGDGDGMPKMETFPSEYGDSCYVSLVEVI